MSSVSSHMPSRNERPIPAARQPNSQESCERGQNKLLTPKMSSASEELARKKHVWTQDQHKSENKLFSTKMSLASEELAKKKQARTTDQHKSARLNKLNLDAFFISLCFVTGSLCLLLSFLIESSSLWTSRGFSRMKAGTGALMPPESVRHEALGKAVSMHQLQLGGVIDKREENTDLRELRQLIKLVRAMASAVLELQMQQQLYNNLVPSFADS